MDLAYKNDITSSEPDEAELSGKIIDLKKRKNVMILAHYYQRPEIQEVADHVGDSLDLSLKASTTDADIILFAGVRFMAETAKLLNSSKRVLLPDMNTDCSLAASCNATSFRKFVEAHPDHVVVTYINSPLEVKALSDIICTSSNAVSIIQSLPAGKPVLFAPDKNLGRYLIQQTGRDMLLWDGVCEVHVAFSREKIREAASGVSLIAHPECEEDVRQAACYVGSTSGLIDYIRQHPDRKFMVATEEGILHQIRKTVPEAVVSIAPMAKSCIEYGTCNCPYMKMNTLTKVCECLENETPEIEIPYSLLERAGRPIQRMIEHTSH